MQDRLRAEIESTSKHRSLGQVEWSRQLSREVRPYFVAVPTAESRAQLGNGADRPRRQVVALDMERSAPKPVDTRDDTRDYTPKLYEELHPRCGVNIGRAPARGAVFKPPDHQSEVVVDVQQFPGWGKGKKGTMRTPSPAPGRASSSMSAAAAESEDYSLKLASRVYSAYTPIPEAPAFGSVESRLTRPKGGFIPRTDERKLMPAPERAVIEPNFDIAKPAKVAVDLSKSSRHFARKDRKSDDYRRMFRTSPPPPLSTPDPVRRTPVCGFAPQRESSDRTVASLLATADADHRRAKKLMQQNFGNRSRSSMRSAMLYTPSPSSSPTSHRGHLGSGSPGGGGGGGVRAAYSLADGSPGIGGNATPAPVG